MSDHPHAPPLTPTHLKHLPLHTHKKCPPTTNYPKYTSTHPTQPDPSIRNIPPVSLTQNIPPTTSTYQKKCSLSHTHPKYTFTQLHPPIKCIHATEFIQNIGF